MTAAAVTTTRDTVTSADGTRIAYETAGEGPPLVLVDGAFCHRKFGPVPALAPLLAKRFTVVSYDRRGRGESGDTPPYAVEREIEDLRALVDVAGGSAAVYGTSSGAVLALRAAAGGVPITRLALYEPPLVLADAPGRIPPDHREEILRLVAAGERGAAVKSFMRGVGVPAFVIPIMRVMPGVWSKLSAVAHTLPHDFAVLGDTGKGKPLPDELRRAMASVRVPTLVGVGGRSPPYMRHAVETVARLVPSATVRVLDGQTHDVSAKALAPVITEWLAEGS